MAPVMSVLMMGREMRAMQPEESQARPGAWRPNASPIMPPGMIQDRDTPAAAMLDMAAVDPRVARYGLEVHGARARSSAR